MRRQINAARRALLGLALLLALSALPAAPAAAQQGGDALTLFEQFLAHRAATIEFVQTTTDSRGEVLETVSGTLSYQRPGKFRLQYDSAAHPLLVSDGETVWLYEADLQQVVVSRSETMQKHGLWQVLAQGDSSHLRQTYVLSAGIRGEVRWLTATARDTGHNLREIALGFAAADGALQQVRIGDTFGGTAHLQVTALTLSAAPDAFHFTPPAGVARVTLSGEQ